MNPELQNYLELINIYGPEGANQIYAALNGHKPKEDGQKDTEVAHA